MTNMLCSLANGRVVVALEVFVIFPVSILPLDRGIGGLQSRIYLKFGIGGHEGPVG